MPALTVFSSGQTVLASAVAADPVHGDLSVHLSNLTAGATYYLQVAAGTSDVFSTGSYQLQIVPDGVAPAAASASSNVTVLPNDLHTNDTFGTATDLRSSVFQTTLSYAYAVQAGISDAADVDYYRLRSPQGATGTTTVMRVLVWGTDVGGLDPAVSVFDSQGKPVAADVLVNENGSFVVQVAGALPNVDYYVAVRAEQPAGPSSAGTYFLGVNFGSQAVSLQSFTGGTLTHASSPDLRTLQVNQSQLFHLVLSADGGPTAAGAVVQMTIYDQTGKIVSTLTAQNGQTQSVTLFLAPGTYTVAFTGIAPAGSSLPPINYTLRGLSLSDPLGPQPIDPTLAPTSPAPSPTQSDLAYYWLQYGYLAFLAMSSPPA
jgi:hypothetical protein